GAGTLAMLGVVLLLFGPGAFYAALLIALAGAVIGIVGLLTGGADLDGVRDTFDRALRLKCEAARSAGRRVTFADLPNLRICAANITLRRLEVFSAQTSPDIPVADAVAASICFPGAFRPWPVARCAPRGNELHLDGGLISNLPAWCLDEERRRDPETLTLAIAIRDGEAPRPPSRRWWLSAMLRTTIFGGEVLSTRGAGPIEVLRLDASVALLAFDIGKKAALNEVREARRAMARLLATRVLGFPDQLRAATAALRDAAAAWEAGICAELRLSAPAADSIRVALGVPEDHLTGGLVLRDGAAAVRSLTLRFGAGFEGWADEGLVLPVEGTTVGEAWRLREPAFRFLDTPDGAFRGPGNEHRARRMRPGLAWVLGVPVAIPYPTPDGVATGAEVLDAVLVVDGMTPVRPDRDDRAAFVTALEGLMSKAIRPRFPEVTGGPP
ncbi:MAG: patatin-like phospholipase family protein, partial [Acetobacteraceae bacterium]|nr:patatin-like phospholipase family protein [Acetobacteraceae bacterium]